MNQTTTQSSNPSSVDTNGITLLHLSDLHISEDYIQDQRVVLAALFSDIERMASAEGRIDLILLTGDLIAKGKYSAKSIELFNAEFIEPLLKTTGVGVERIFACPGNHDLQLPNIQPLYRKLLDSLDDTSAVNSMLDDLPGYPFVYSGFVGFNELTKEFGRKNLRRETPLYRAFSVDINTIRVGISCLNSAWRATGRPNDLDYGELVIGQRQVDALSEEMKNCNLKLGLMHHPVAWLAPFDSSDVERQLYISFDGLFMGHTHDADSFHVARPNGSVFVSRAGCLYQSRKYFNGYTRIRYVPAESRWDVAVREYFDQRREFDECVRFHSQGRATFFLPKASESRDLIVSPSSDYILAVEEAVDSQMLPRALSDIAPKSLRSLYVSPRLSFVSEKQLNAESSNGEKIRFVDIGQVIQGNKPFMFVGPKESGKTTILHHLCEESGGLYFQDRARFGAYINLTHTKSSRAGILASIVSFTRATYRRAEFLRFLAEGRMTLCFDNVPPHDGAMLKAVEDFTKEFPGNRYYFSLLEDWHSSLTQKVIPRFDLDMDVVYIHSFGRRQTRELVARWFGRQDAETEEDVELLLASLRRLNIPRTPFLISILIWVREKKVPFSPVNQSEILEVLIDGLLEKLHEEKTRASLDANVKRHFLTEFAYALHSAKKRTVTPHELEKFATDYFEKKLLVSASAPFLDELKAKGVLVDFGNEIGFKFDCYRAFFLAAKLKESSVLLTYALTPAGFDELSEELDYYTGTNRDRADILRGALSALDTAFAGADLGLPLELFDEFTNHGSPLTREKRDAIEQKLFGERPSLEKQQHLLDEADEVAPRPLDTSKPQRPSSGSNSVSVFVRALTTASAVLRNSELVDDGDLKREAYAKIITRWCHLLLAVTALIELVVNPESEKALEEALEGIPTDQVLYIARLFVPNAILGMVLEYLGTAKLQLVIDEDIKKSPETVRKLVSVFLYADLSLPDRIKRLRSLTETEGISHFTLELILFKLVHLFTFRKLSGAEEGQLKELAGDVFAKITAAPDKRTREAVRQKIIQGLDRRRLLQHLKDGNAA